MNVAGYVLAGGASSRFGSDKSQAVIGGRPMLGRMQDLLRSVSGQVRVVAGSGRIDSDGVSVVADRWPGQGPLCGIITALLYSGRKHETPAWNLIIGCDMPFLTRDWLAYLVERTHRSTAEVLVPRSSSGLEPLCACWKTAAGPKLQSIFDRGIRRVTDGMRTLEMEILDETHWKRFDNAGRLFWNMNTQADYDEAKRIVEGTAW